MHTVFRTHGITPMDENHRLFQVELTLTSDDDKDLRVLTDHIGEEIKGSIGWCRLSSLLSKLGMPEKAREVDALMLDQTTEQSEKEHPYGLIALVKKTKDAKEYDKVIKTDKEALLIRQQSFPSNHSDLVDSCNYSATVYYNIRDYSKALFYFEKVFEIQKQSLPSNHPDFAISCNNIGNVYNKVGEYSKALSYNKKALEIQQQSLPSNHPDLGTSYNNIGTVYMNMRDYSNAFSFFERAVDIGQHSLPSNHPHLKEWRKNLEHAGKSSHVFIIV
jgi:tetratricopeptide (TPR) repeat protein